MPSSRGFSRPRDRTCISCVSCFGRQIVHHCVTWPFAGTFLGCQPKSLCWPLQHSSLRVIRLILWLFKSPSTSVPVNTTEAVLHFLIQPWRSCSHFCILLVTNEAQAYPESRREDTPVFWLGESHGQMNLVGCSPQDGKESDITEVTQYSTAQHSMIAVYFHLNLLQCR